jgi:hypothetical protein
MFGETKMHAPMKAEYRKQGYVAQQGQIYFHLRKIA